MKQKMIRAAAAVVSVLTAAGCIPSLSAQADYGVGGNGTAIMEYLDRGIYAVNAGSGMFVSWRWNANDADDAEFRLYRDGELIYTSTDGATSYLDKGGSTGSKYRVDTLANGTVVSSETCHFTSGSNYFDIPLNSPGSQYSPNDCCVGDVDGDGQYEIFLKWDPSNAQDNSKSGYTDNVYIDCMTLEGQMLWRIDLGRNIRAGQHYTQMCVADFDCDGMAELITKTSDGTKDGKGQVIGNGSADYRNEGGYVLSGPEYITLFEGLTGAALSTIDFPVSRGDVSAWGDKYGNRVDRFNGGIAYLDGEHPSAVYGRGYYTRLTVSAFDVVDKQLVKRWVYDTGNNSSTPGYGDGNHNMMAADVDNDGKQEICMGSSCIDDNGRLLWTTRKGHGDAMHLGDLVPERPGLELFMCHEPGPYGVSLIDAKDGSIIFHIDGDKDTGRCCADNVYAGNAGAELCGSRPANTVLKTNGQALTNNGMPTNFLIYWDGDLEREFLDDINISKMIAPNNIVNIFKGDGCYSNNGTKAVPCLTADLFGDWREELVLRTTDNSKLRVFCTTAETQVRLTTLMHDMQYRAQNCCQQSSYNQPPHVSYYLGSDAPLPARPDIKLNNTPPAPLGGELIKDISVTDTAHKRSWEFAESASVGGKIFGDRDFTYTTLPDELVCAEAILTACDSKYATGDLASFTAGGNMTVYILYDNRVTPLPSWMQGWTKTDMTAQSSNEVTFDVYSKEFAAGDVVTLGENGMSSYCVNYTVMAKGEKKPLIGDVNLDGAVNIADSVALHRYLLGLADLPAETQGDMNGDGRINAVDLTLHKKLILSMN